MLLALLATASLLETVWGATIQALSVSRGSVAGGTYVTIFGDGFFRSGQDGSTRV